MPIRTIKKRTGLATIIALVSVSVAFFAVNSTEALSKHLMGRIVILVEKKGEAWYIRPDTGKRVYLSSPEDAFDIARKLGVGITNRNLERIPVAEANILNGKDEDDDGLSDNVERSFGTDSSKTDTDGDGYDDKIEIIQGYNPLGAGAYSIDYSFARQQSGKIFLQTERNGEAWYINPVNAKRYFLGRPRDAFNVMRITGLGVSNKTIDSIGIDTAIKQITSYRSKTQFNKGDSQPFLDRAIIFSLPPSSQPNDKSSFSNSEEPVLQNPVLELGPNEMALEQFTAAAEAISKKPIELSEQSTRTISENERLTADAFAYTGTQGNIGPHTMLLDWRTNEPSLSWILYGTTPDLELEYKGIEYKKKHIALLSNLAPDTIYYYMFRARDKTGAIHNSTVTTQKTPVTGKETSEKTAFFFDIGDESSGTSPLGTGTVRTKISFSKELPESFWKKESLPTEDIRLDMMVAEPLSIKSPRVIVERTSIRMEWDLPQTITAFGYTPTGISSVTFSGKPETIRVDYGLDDGYGFREIVDQKRTPSYPNTMFGDTSLAIKDVTPGKTYHLRITLSSFHTISGQLITDDITVTTPLQQGEQVIIPIDMSYPSITKFNYPSRANLPFMSFSTDSPSYAALAYGRLDSETKSSVDQRVVVSKTMSTSHTLQLDGLTPGNVYEYTLLISEKPIDFPSEDISVYESIELNKNGYRSYNFNLTID